jgi:hypothetical protein
VRVLASRAMRRSWTALVALLSALSSVHILAAAERDLTVVQALEQLRGEGLNIIYSSALIPHDLRAASGPQSGTLAEQARRLLAPHGLDLMEVSAGHYVIVPLTPEQGIEPAAEPAPKDPRPAAQELPAVSVLASRYEIDRQPGMISAQLSAARLDTLPGLDQDALAAVRYLPGTSSVAASPRIHVRGGRENEVAVYFDGVPLLQPFHFKDYPHLQGILDPGALAGLDLFSGILPARYGDALSGVLDVKPRRWDGETHNELGVSVLYFHGLSQGRLERLPMEWLFAVRRSRSGDSFQVADLDLGKPLLQDVLGRIQLDVGENAQLTVGGLVLDDRMDDFDFNEDGGPGATYRDTTGWLAWRQEWPSGAALDALVSTTRARSTRDGSVVRHRSAQMTERRNVVLGTARMELTLPLSDALRSAFGLEWADSAAHFDESLNSFLPLPGENTLIPDALGKPVARRARMFDLARDRTSFAAYGSLYSQLNERLSTEIGLRWDVQDYGARRQAMQVTPRYSAAYRLSDRTLIRAALGWQAQSQRPYELRAADEEKEFHSAERVRQAVLSLDHRLSGMIDMRFEAYAKRVRDPAPYYENMFDPVTIFPELEIDRVQVVPEKARMFGAEVSLRWALPQTWSGWFQYTWAEAEDVIDGRSVPRTWSTPHAVNAGVAWSRFPWQLTVSPHWRTGWRTTLLSQSETEREDLHLGPRNAERWPDFFSLDFRASWSYPMRWGELRVLGEVLNATSASTICCGVYTAQGAAPLLNRSLQDGLPRTYYLGLTWTLP